MTRRVLLAWTALALCFLAPGCGGPPQLDGSWFVLYASDPKPYLDVAFRGRHPDTVQVVLSGPEDHKETLGLTWNPQDEEWQVVPTHLPDPLPGGVWWVSEVQATSRSGISQWIATSPSSPYVRTVNGQNPTSVEPTPGFFYSPEPGVVRVRIESRAPRGGTRGDPVMAVFADGQFDQWVAANDDYDVQQPYPTIVMPVQPGATYFVRVTGAEDDSGHYAIRVVPESHPRVRPPEVLGKIPDAYEADETPRDAKIVPLETWIHRSLGGTPLPDVDWIRFVAPKPAANAEAPPPETAIVPIPSPQEP